MTAKGAGYLDSVQAYRHGRCGMVRVHERHVRACGWWGRLHLAASPESGHLVEHGLLQEMGS